MIAMQMSTDMANGTISNFKYSLIADLIKQTFHFTQGYPSFQDGLLTLLHRSDRQYHGYTNQT
jgi:hypothetical protein